MSVPERIGAYRSATAAVCVKRGSTQMSCAPRSLARVIHFIEIGWFDAGLAPMTRMTSAFLRSFQ